MNGGWTRTGRNLGAAALVAACLAAAPRGGHPPVGAGAGGAGSCVACHEQTAVLSHPIDVYPSMAVPAHLPLASGRLTCLTCHDLDAPPGAGLLRGAALGAAADWCGQCHDAATARAGDVHALAMPRAHYAPSDHRRRATGLAGALGAGPDRESTECLGCHDGNLARGGRIRAGAGRRLGGAMPDGDHPIAVVQRPRGTDDHLVWPDRLDPAVRLFDGRVGCGSCHSPYAGGDYLLVMSNEGSRLCLACHDF